ncbi:hypothetical protein T4D_14956 [Trichinella pseudospiralis]|uniref:Uncharacterized protein n=1 Tax=Trichinella pseudospiralis TaxID=6337 RepID=A0A0V1FJR8_TRIPS|nr:hypothetical protein T4D_14956 [Trichinella pseudospiralis]
MLVRGNFVAGKVWIFWIVEKSTPRHVRLSARLPDASATLAPFHRGHRIRMTVENYGVQNMDGLEKQQKNKTVVEFAHFQRHNYRDAHWNEASRTSRQMNCNLVGSIFDRLI